MRPLKDIVLALKSELDAAFAATKADAPGTWLEVEKVTLSLAIGLHDKPAAAGDAAVGFVVLDDKAAAKSSGHRLTIELRVPRPASLVGDAPEPKSAAAPPSAVGSIFDLASRVFGAPGFDNAARAEVFCEAIGGLSEAEARTVMASLLGNVPLDDNGPLDGARIRTRRLLRFAPVGEAAAAATLAEVFRRFPVKEIIAIVSARWKMTSGWSPNDDSAGRYSSN